MANVALVTGGARGIGLGISHALSQDGWDLAVFGQRSSSDIADVLDQLRRSGGKVVYFQGDVASDRDRRSIIGQVRDQFGRLNLLVNNAGITSPGRHDILEATEDSFDRVMAVNLKGAHFLAQLAARWMIEQRQADSNCRATIINISSISGEFSSLDRGDYCVSWACMAQMTRIWAARLAEFGIGVYEVRPGIIATDMTKPVAEKYDRLIAGGLTAERRWGTPEDVGRAVAVLARGDITYATGAVITVDGGLSMLRDLDST